MRSLHKYYTQNIEVDQTHTTGVNKDQTKNQGRAITKRIVRNLSVSMPITITKKYKILRDIIMLHHTQAIANLIIILQNIVVNHLIGILMFLHLDTLTLHHLAI